MRGSLRNGVCTLALCAYAVTLAGCGGGKGARPQPAPAPPAAPLPPPPPPPPPVATNYDDAEYARSNGASAHGAITAYNAGGTGQGVKIGIIDSGINPDLPDFAGKIDSASRDLVGSRGVSDTEGHGTAVSAVAAAARNGQQIMGVAFNSTIISLNSSNPDDCTPEKGCKHSESAIALGIDAARLAGARVINLSLGGDGVGSSVLNALQRATSAGIVVVMSAGNDGAEATGGNPKGFALTSAQQAGNGLIVIAGAHDADRNIAPFSNRAGEGAQYYLTALGSRVRTINHEGVGYLYSGTSFSAPVISGAAALLASAFPNLTGAQIVQLLLSTADDAGEVGRDTVFGNGILNIHRAFQPQGKTTLAGSAVAVDLDGEGQGSGAMGPIKGEMGGAIILDGYSRAYATDFAARIRSAPQERPLSQAVDGTRYDTSAIAVGKTAVSLTMSRSRSGQAQLGLAPSGLRPEDAQKARFVAGAAVSRLTPQTAVAFGISESGRALQQRLSAHEGNVFLVARDPMARMGFHAETASAIGVRHGLGPVAVTATAERGEVYSAPGSQLGRSSYTLSAITADSKMGPATIAAGVTRLDEERSVLGGRFSSAFSDAGSTSYFLDATARIDLGRGWGGSAGYRRGWTMMPGSGALVEKGRLDSDAFAFDLTKANAFTSGDRLSARVMQPLRVRNGGFDLNVPVSYDYSNGSVGYEHRFFNLAPSGRERTYEAAYAVGLLGGDLGLNAYLRSSPGHARDARDDLGAAVRYTLGF